MFKVATVSFISASVAVGAESDGFVAALPASLFGDSVHSLANGIRELLFGLMRNSGTSVPGAKEIADPKWSLRLGGGAALGRLAAGLAGGNAGADQGG